VEQELLTLPEHLSLPLVCIGARVDRSLVFYAIFCRSVGVIHPDVTNGFTLSIMDVRMSDTGVYECQFGVRNPSRQCFGLQVVQTWQWNLFGLFLIVVFLWYYVCLIPLNTCDCLIEVIIKTNEGLDSPNQENGTW
jgi:hypothetical protein